LYGNKTQGAINDRNQLSHIYRQEMAETIRQRLPEYAHMVERIVSVMHLKINGF